MRDAVKNFASEMEAKLQMNDDEKGEDGWLDFNCTILYLLKRLDQEIKEAHDAFNECNSEQLFEECVDVANFAMMISDRLKHNKLL